jgi:hypothetical protein
MTNDPRDVEAAVRAFSHACPEEAFEAGESFEQSLILAARYAREAAEARTVEGVDPDLVAVREIVALRAAERGSHAYAFGVRNGAADGCDKLQTALSAYKAGKEARQ